MLRHSRHALVGREGALQRQHSWRAHVEVTPHTLLHSFAKNLVNAGVSLEKVAALLGTAA